MIIENYGIRLRSVEIADAEFIVNARTDEKRSRFISTTNPDIEKQQEWIKSYKVREIQGTEYYFIAEDEEGESFATYRIYDITNDTCEIGSWVTLPGYTKSLNAIKVDIMMKEFAFEDLGFDQIKFEVRKKNFSVLKYHSLFKPTIYNETEKDVYFILNKEDFFKQRNRLFNNIK